MSKSTSPKRRKHSMKEHNPQKVCRESGGKHCFGKRKAALTKLNRMKNADHLGTKPTGIYKCQHCGDWHLTSIHSGTH